MQFQSVEFHERGKKHKENVQRRIEEVRSWILTATLVFGLINPLIPMPALTGCDESWPFFHF